MDGLKVTGGSRRSGYLAGELSLVEGIGMLIDAGSPTLLDCCFTANGWRSSEGALVARNGSNPLLSGCTFLDSNGPGMFCTSNSNPVLTNSRFEANDGLTSNRSSPLISNCRFIIAGSCGIPAAHCDSVLTDCVFEGADSGTLEYAIFADFESSLSLRDCMFTHLGAGAIRTFWPGNLDLLRCTFAGNSGPASSTVVCEGLLTARECVFSGNRARMSGAISGYDVELDDCEFTGNSGSNGAVCGMLDLLIASGCVFAGNSGDSGAGAILSDGGLLLLSNCTFVGNRGQSGAIYRWRDTVAVEATVTQCIVREGPNPFERYPVDQSRLRITYSDVEGGWPGRGQRRRRPMLRRSRLLGCQRHAGRSE
jgi:parallel beta-helix repeat protein